MTCAPLPGKIGRSSCGHNQLNVTVPVDWFSSAVMFPGWAEYGDEAFLWRGPETYDPLVVYQPKTWLLREGWKKAGTISCREIPSAQR